MVKNATKTSEYKQKKFYFMPNLEVKPYEETSFKNNNVYIFEHIDGIYFAVNVKTINNMHTTIDFKSADSNGKLNNILFSNFYKSILVNISNLFKGVEYQLFGVLKDNNVYFYCIVVNDNVVDIDDTINIFTEFGLSMPKVFYDGDFNKDKIKSLMESHDKFFIRLDYTKYEPKFILSLYDKTKKGKEKIKIPGNLIREIIHKVDFFLEKKDAEIINDIMNEYLDNEAKFRDGNTKDFISFYMMRNFTAYKKSFIEDHPTLMYREQALDILKRKLSFKVKSIVEG